MFHIECHSPAKLVLTNYRIEGLIGVTTTHLNVVGAFIERIQQSGVYIPATYFCSHCDTEFDVDSLGLSCSRCYQTFPVSELSIGASLSGAYCDECLEELKTELENRHLELGRVVNAKSAYTKYKVK